MDWNVQDFASFSNEQNQEEQWWRIKKASGNLRATWQR